MSNTGLQARKSAVYLLDQVLEEGRLMSELIGTGALDKLPSDDRARAQRLAQDTLRGLERADRLLQKHLNKQPSCPLTAQALNRSAIGALVAGVALNRDLLRGFRCWVCAVGRGDFASIDRGHSDEHSTIDTNYTASRPDDCRYDIAQSRPCIPDQPPARL